MKLSAVFDRAEERPELLSGRIDPWLAGSIFALLSFGLVMVYSASAFLSLKAGNEFLYLKKQGFFIGLGLIGMLVTASIDYRSWIRYLYPLLALSFLSLVLLQVPGLGTRVNGAVRWYRFGGGQFQPSEVAKLALAFYLAYSLARKGDQIKNFSVGFLPTSLVAGLFVAVVLVQPDLGTSAVLGVITVSLMLVAGARLSFLLFGAVAAAPLLYHQLFGVEWRARRLMAFMDPWAYQKDFGYQLVQSLKALGSGGVSGVGLGESKVKLGFLPEAHTDFIVPIIGEELGFLGLCLLVGLFLLFAWRGYLVAYRCPDRFGSYLAFGITTWFCFQALVNLCVVTGLAPTKGLTLPFVSYGGSSMLACLAAAGILLNISAMDPPPAR
jgi:cell division protein FtsW